MVNLIFSRLKKDITSASQDLVDGGDSAFQCKSILLRAINEAKPITFCCLFVKTVSSSGTPKIAICGQGRMVVSNTSDITSKKNFQNVANLGQDQNMWDKFPGDWEHLLQLSVMSGYIFAS